jgi:hypothetical protein
MSFGKIHRGGVAMEDEMRLYSSTTAGAGLACGFVLVALALATPNSVAFAQSNASVSRHQTAQLMTVALRRAQEAHLGVHQHAGHRLPLLGAAELSRQWDPRAIAQVPAAPAFFPFDWSGSYVPAPRKPETDGLSRNPDDCVKYGCIDDGGG